MSIRVYAAFALIVLSAPLLSYAQSPAEIREQINEQNAQIEALNKEIAEFEAQLQVTRAEKNTLQSRVNELDLQRKKLNSQISVTRSEINRTQLQITQLQRGINTAEDTIKLNQAALGESLRNLDRSERRPLALTILSSDTMTDAWQDVDALATLQGAVQQDIQLLIEEKAQLAETKVTAEDKQAELVGQQDTLVTQQSSLQATINAESEILQRTKSQESEYQRILSEAQAAKASFEAALADLNEQFRRALDPSTVPTAGKGILRTPVDNVRITQYFGNTAFASSGAYNGKGHNGIDYGVPAGSRVKAALSGVVIGSGNTDAVCRDGSFGNWIMIKHNNGLSTMYAHLTERLVSNGQSVETGQTIGRSGGERFVFGSGYSTGPHLHFGVYVTSVTEIIQLGQATNRVTPCAKAVMPVPRSQEGYLNPLNYL
jgi:murein DD-endopeptidase MepM/ murein hydrolase activator NlpD